ncbi:MAG: hypothetical protein ABI091_21470, partial [Ferruginibacter sp.]
MRILFICCIMLAPALCAAQQEDSTINIKKDTKDKSYFEVATSFGNSYFSSKNKSLNAKGQPSVFVITPSVSYYHKSGLGLTASAYLINSGDSSGFYQYSLSPSYQLTNNDKVDATVSYTRYFVKKGYEAISSPFKNEFYGQVNLKKPWLQPGISMGYSSGSFTTYNNVDTVLLGARRKFTDTVSTKVSGFTLSTFVQHEFDFYELINKNDELTITPQFLLNTGSSTFEEKHQNPFYTRRLQKASGSKLLKKLGRLNQQTPFEIESLALSTDANYAIGKFSVDTQLYLDYYLPATKSKRFTSIYSV